MTTDATAPPPDDATVAGSGARTPNAAAYTAVADSPEFDTLRRTFRRFVFPMTVAFLVWYLLYVVLSAYARDFMGTKVVGNINIALIFGLLQFLSTFLIAWWYARWAHQKLDTDARGLRTRAEGDGR